ncbi:MAG: hypothetical protein CEO12_55 [Parcubacteria group bacterium Gr01-1014_46]|nr:MAG: hypothetical protein CEO12_55 [Parcubacteria group bacterium Gr01-1014_46]
MRYASITLLLHKKIYPMKKGSTLFLKFVLVVVALGALALMLWEPHLEGRNVNATLFQIYFNDPFLAYAYIASIPFFIAIYQAFKLLGYIGQNKVFSLDSVGTLRTIKYCAMTLIGFIVGAEVYFNTVERSKGEDIAGGVVIGLVMIFLSAVIATAAAVFERLLQNAIDIKTENDLTV